MLDCAHCGDEAIEESADGLYFDGDGGACMTCGFPGAVVVDDATDDEIPEAYWSIADEDGAACQLPDCRECRPSFWQRLWFRIRTLLRKAGRR